MDTNLQTCYMLQAYQVLNGILRFRARPAYWVVSSSYQTAKRAQ